MSGELRVFRFGPGQPGRGGITSGLHSFLGIEDLRFIHGYRPERKMWKRDTLWTKAWAPVGGLPIMAFHDWEFFSAGATTPTNRRVVAAGGLSGGNPTVTFSVIVDSTTARTIYTEGTTGGVSVPAVITPVRDRLFMSSGLGPGRLWPGTISGTTVTKVAPIGVPAPRTAPKIAVTYNFTAGEYYYAAAGSDVIHFPSLATNTTYDGLVENETVRLTHETLANPDYVERKVVRRISGKTNAAFPNQGPFPLWSSSTGLRLDSLGTETVGNPGKTWVIDGGLPSDENGICTHLIGLALRCALAGTTGPWTIVNAVNNNDGTTTVTTAEAHVENVADVGFSIEGVRVYLDGTVPGASQTKEDVNRKVSRPAPGAGYTSWSGAEAPGYAYAYYDPVSGHISNLSPVTYLDTTDVVNGKIQINIECRPTCADGTTIGAPIITSLFGLEYVSNGDTAYNDRFTDIIFFRTRRVGGGAVLYPIGSLDSTSGSYAGISGVPSEFGDLTWTDTYGDEDLVISGRLRAPLLTNHPPRYVGLTGYVYPLIPHAIVWWDGRVWMYGDPDMSAVHYSCDTAQCGMGRHDESFPDGNRLVIPAGSGKITSMLTVGEYLLINTASDSYVVQGNHETNYRLVRIANELGGVKRAAITEIPLGVEGQGMVAAVTSDRRVLVGQLGGKLEDIGLPIRDKLGYCWGTAFYRAGGHPRLAISAGASSSLGGGDLYEYNFDHQTWSSNTPEVTGGLLSPLESLFTVPRSEITSWPQDQSEPFLLGGSAGQLIIDAVSTAPKPGAYFSTWDLPADRGKRRYSFAWARLVLTSDYSGLATMPVPTLTVYANDESMQLDYTYTFAPYSDPSLKTFGAAQGKDGYVRELVCYAGGSTDAPVEFGVGSLPTGYRLSFALTFSGSTVQHNIAYLDIALREEQDDGWIDG